MNTQKRLLLISLFLLLTLGVRAYVSGAPRTVAHIPLDTFPQQLADWRLTGESKISESVAGVLRADDYINRRYRDSAYNNLDLFIAYYQVQRAGESMHSPKNCLPGSGWSPVLNDYVIAHRLGQPVQINRYVIQKDNDRSLVLYWYQAGGRVIANAKTVLVGYDYERNESTAVPDGWRRRLSE